MNKKGKIFLIYVLLLDAQDRVTRVYLWE